MHPTPPPSSFYFLVLFSSLQLDLLKDVPRFSYTHWHWFHQCPRHVLLLQSFLLASQQRDTQGRKRKEKTKQNKTIDHPRRCLCVFLSFGEPRKKKKRGEMKRREKKTQKKEKKIWSMGTAVTRHWAPASMFLMKINDDVLLC